MIRASGRRIVRFTTALIATIVMATSVGGPTPLARADSLLRASLTPTTGLPGVTPLLKSIDPCPDPPEGTTAFAFSRDVATGYHVGATTSNGSWSVLAPFVGDEWLPGSSHTFEVTCRYGNVFESSFDETTPYATYANLTYKVKRGAQPTLTVSPNKLDRAGVIHVAPTSPCPVAGEGVSIATWPSEAVVPNLEINANRSGGWKAAIDLAKFRDDMKRGPIYVYAICHNPTLGAETNAPWLRYAIATVSYKPTSSQYAALGDSYSSGEGVPDFLAPSDADGCHRSTRAYSEQFRALYGWVGKSSFVACSGAKIGDIYHGMRGEPSQFDTLDKKTGLISLTAGGNDVEFAPILRICVAETACEVALAVPTAALIKKTKPRLKKLYKKILQDAPKADLYVLGYPRFFSQNPSVFCNGIDVTEALWLNSATDSLNISIKKAIKSVGSKRIHYVDTSSAFAGGELCSGDVPVYMNGIINDHKEYSFHPTAGGHAMLARRLLAAVEKDDA